MKKQKRRPQGHKQKKWIPLPKNRYPFIDDPDDAILVRDVFPPDKNPKPKKYGTVA